ncbi:UNVERIFIED_CONTAM: hypothetical protein Scaly_2740500 [Sesamum calycinum]|uniref:Ternary complex factor MIP1 leucine-zipper domain-containing protein n=1 Tax=Sesamum calycinum TaxID=2727403 RepID=A0AAW2J116_9LAMI
MELKGGKSETAEKTMANRRRSARERKMALLQDVDNLKKKLRHEENVHRALQRAFNRPLGALPRLPPYLPQNTLELLAEVAVLEEEVVRLEEQVVNFRQGLYQEAVYISSRKSPSPDLTPSRNELTTGSSIRKHSRSSSQSEANLGSSRPSPLLSRIASTRKFLSADSPSDGLRNSPESPCNGKQPQNEQGLALENGLGGDNQSSSTSDKDKLSPPKKSLCRTVEQAQESSSGSSDDRVADVESEANRMSEDILKCLINIFVRLSSSKGKTMDFESFSPLSAKALSENNVESNFRDPYCNFSELKKRDVGSYKHLYAIEARSVDLNRKTNASFLIRRLKILLDKLATVELDGLNHQQKLAFWINIYNSCIMNAFLEHGIPDSPNMIVLQMQKASISITPMSTNLTILAAHLIRIRKFQLSSNNKGRGTCAERPNDRTSDLETSISLKICKWPTVYRRWKPLNFVVQHCVSENPAAKSLCDIIRRLASNQPRTTTGRFVERLAWSGQNHWSHLHCPAEAGRHPL